MATFPAFDDVEPPPRTRRQRWLRFGLVIGVLALGATAAVAVPRWRDDRTVDRVSATATPSPSASARGTSLDGILWYDGDGVSIADPDGGRRQRVSAVFATSQQRFQAALSPDGRSLVTNDGYVVSLGGGALPTPARVFGPDITEAYVPPTAWSAGGTMLAVEVSHDGGPQIGLVTVGTGELSIVGTGTAPAGDPRIGAVVFAAGLTEKPGGNPAIGNDVFLDTDRIERLEPAQLFPTVLFTKAELLQLMHLPPDTPAAFASLALSPDGDNIAFVAIADTRDPGKYGPTERSAIGVLSRAGDIRAFHAADALTYLQRPAWSPAGDQLVFAEISNDDTKPGALYVWDLAGSRPCGDLRELEPAQGIQPFGHGECMWRPDSTAVLCGDHRAWYVVPLAGGRASVAESVPGSPLAWVSVR